MKAFQWTLRSTYRKARCDSQLVFEVDDPIRTGRIVDWAGLRLGLEELMMDKDWYCSSGLKNRGQTLESVGVLKSVLWAQ